METKPKPKHFHTLITVSTQQPTFEREGCMYFANRVNVCFNVMLSTLSLQELGELLEHQEKTTSLIEQYRRKLNSEAIKDEKAYDSDSG